MKTKTNIFLLLFLAIQVYAEVKITKLDSLQKVLTGKIHDTIRVKTLIELAQEHYLSSPALAQKDCEEAKDISEKIKYENGLVNAYGWLAYLFEQQGQIEKALAYKNRYGVDGIMIGRTAIGYPWIFQEIKHYLKTGTYLEAPSLEERIDVIRQHLYRSIEWKGNMLGILEMRRHYSNYLKGIPHIKEVRNQLVQKNSLDEIEEVLEGLMRNAERGMRSLLV